MEKHSVSKWDLMEIIFNVKISGKIQFEDINVLFSSPTGCKHKVRAFYYDNDIRKVRFTPNETGLWQYYAYTLRDNHEYSIDRGIFKCIDSDKKGFVKINAEKPYKFEYSNGEPVFLSGDTCYSLLLLDREKQRIPYLKRRSEQGFNFFRFMTFFGIGKEDKHAMSYNTDGELIINALYFKRMDELMEDLFRFGCGAEMIIFNLYEDMTGDMLVQNGWNEQKEVKWFKYLVDRYGAYTNLFYWTIANEFDLYPDGKYRLDIPEDIEWYRKITRTVKMQDIYQHPVAVHPVNTFECPSGGPLDSPGYDFGNCASVDIVMNQVHGFVTPRDGYYDGNGIGIESKVLADRKYNKPVIIGEFGYEFNNLIKRGMNVSTRMQLMQAWRIIMGGGYFAAGFRGSCGCSFITAFDIENNGCPGATLISVLNSFFRVHTRFNELEPHWEFVDKPNLCIASPCEEYVVFVIRDGKYVKPGMPDNTAVVDLSDCNGVFAVEWLDIYTGEYIIAGNINGGKKVQFVAPLKKEAVLHLYNKSVF